MRSIVYASTIADLKLWSRSDVSEVIIACKDFSRRGTVTLEEALELNNVAHELGLKTAFEWDALMEEPRFRMLAQKLPSDFKFDAVRVRDAGAIRFMRDNSSADLHLLLEAGHHNKMAIRSWQNRLGERLKRIVLSPELPLSTLKAWREEFKLEMEILVLGPLLLFHSPRPLLSSLSAAPKTEEIVAAGASEESPHKGFPLTENTHGTLMFHPKDLGLLERWQEISDSGMDVVRIDHRHEAHSIRDLVATFLAFPVTATRETLRAAWSRDWMRGYFDVNKSDVLFSKLKNQHTATNDSVCAEVLEGKREGWLAVRVRGAGLKKGMTTQLVNPEGEKKSVTLMWLKDDAFNPTEELAPGMIGFIPWVSGAPSKSKFELN